MSFIYRFKGRKRPRQLRYYKSIARKSYECRTCRFQINPGEEYEGYVMVLEGKLWVLRFHFPICPFDPDEEHELMALMDEIEHHKTLPLFKKTA